jgi:hypothetical protein
LLAANFRSAASAAVAPAGVATRLANDDAFFAPSNQLLVADLVSPAFW